MSFRIKIWRFFKVLFLLFILFVGSLTVYILNAYKSRVSEEELDKLITLVNNSPSYSSRVYQILGGIEHGLNSSNTEFKCWTNKRVRSAPSRLIANLMRGTWLEMSSLALKLDRELEPKKLVNYNLSKWSFSYNQVGLKNAANFFYKKSIDSLSDRELISLGAMFKASTFYNPLRNPENNKRRTEILISDLKKQGVQLDSSCN